MTLRRHWVAVALGLAAFVAALLVRRWLVPLGSGNADEGAYAYLAELLRHRHVTMSSATHVPFFRPWLTGTSNARLFFQYEPGWPAVLALSQTLLGTKVVASAACATGLVATTYALALRLFASRRTAIIAAGLIAFSPLFLLHSALYLSYLFTTLLATFAVLGIVTAVQRGSRAWAAASGAAIGAMLLTRPLDGVLTAVTVALFAAVLARGAGTRLRRLVAVAVIAAVPFLLAVAVFNVRTTGSVTSFPLTAADPRNTFGFGERGLQIDASSYEYEFGDALAALGLNTRGAAGWILGGVVTIAAAVWATTIRDRRGPRLVLLFNVVLYPVVYFFWWATMLAADGATNGLGPHYYVPAFVPLAILGADGFARLSRRHLAAGVTVAVLAVVVTLVNVPDKIDGQSYATNKFVEVDRAIPDDLDNAIVFVATEHVERFTIREYPFLISDPDIGGPVLFPSDRHGENGWLLQDFPERQAYLLHRELQPGDNLLHPRLVLTPIGADWGSEVAVRVRVRGPASAPLRTYVQTDDGSRIPLDGALSPGAATDVEIRVRASAAASNDPAVVVLTPGHHDVRIGVESATGERWTIVYRADVRVDQTLTVVHPGTGEHYVNLSRGPVVLHENVSDVISDVR